MSSRKRSYSLSTNANKATRMVGGRVLTYRPSTAVPGSFRAMQRSYGRQTGELKGCDILLTQAAPIINTTGSNANIMLLNGIAPGTASYNRVGRKLTFKSLRLKGCVEFTSTPSATGVQFGNFVRMVVVWDKQPTGTIPTWETVFGYTLENASEASTILAPVRYDNMSRFSVLKDTVIEYDVQPSSPVSTASVTEQVPFDCYVNLGNKVTTYGGQNVPTTIADIATGALYVMWRAHINNAGQQVASVSNVSVGRVRYVD